MSAPFGSGRADAWPETRSLDTSARVSLDRAGRRLFPGGERMITAYVPHNGTVERVDVGLDRALPADVLWLDLFEPTVEETAKVQKTLGLALPTREEMREIEPSSRLYIEGDASYMTAQVL